MTYAVHTEPCTYLLDEEGVCRWIVSPKGLLEDATSDCVGAQFVACLDLSAPGGLVAELRVGGMALFVRADVEGRLVLLRTRTITHVESRAVPEDPPTTRMPPKPPPARRWVEETITLPKPLYRVPSEREPPPSSRTPPRPRANVPPPMRVVPPSMTPARVAPPPGRAVPTRVAPPPPPPKSRRVPDPKKRR